MEPPEPVEQDAVPPLAALVDEITSGRAGMPVRAMEIVLASGIAAVPALAGALVRWQDDEDRELLWPVVLLGEIREAAGIEPLMGQLRRNSDSALAEAAAESLAKIGSDAVPALVELVRTGAAGERMFGYGALGWIADRRAYAELVGALDRDVELADIAAVALVFHGDPDAIPPIYEAYRRCPPEHRAAFESALWDLEHEEADEPLWTIDWRIRYRPRLEDQGMVEPDWLSVAAVMRNVPEENTEPPLPLRTLEEILADPAAPEDPPDTCEDCGEPLDDWTGVSACPETTVAVIATQIGIVEAAIADGEDLVLDLWDRLEDDYWALLEEGEPRRAKASGRWRDALDLLELGSRTCRSLLEQGVESNQDALTMLRALALDAAAQYGDPQGLLAPATPGPPRQKIGRNARCPCGSGRKYKVCCMDRA